MGAVQRRRSAPVSERGATTPRRLREARAGTADAIPSVLLATGPRRVLTRTPAAADLSPQNEGAKMKTWLALAALAALLPTAARADLGVGDEVPEFTATDD